MNVLVIVIKVILCILVFIPPILRADFIDELERLEASIPNDIALATKEIQKYESREPDFTNEEKSLYQVTRAHIELLNSNFKQAELLLEDLLNSKAGANYKARAHSLMASIYSATGEYDETYYHLDWSIRLLDQVDKERYKVTILSNALNSYNDLEMTSYSMDYAVRLLRFGEKTDNKFAVCLAKVELTLIEIQLNDIAIARERLEETKDICSEGTTNLIQLTIQIIEARIALLSDERDKAKRLLEKYYPITEKFGWGIFTCIVEVSLAETYYQLEQYQKARIMAMRGFERADQVNDLKRKKQASRILANIETELGNEDEAIKYYKKYIQLEQEYNTSLKQRKLSYSRAAAKVLKEQEAEYEGH
ncbi:tetratricopeptide repeat protein [Kangiella sediminilitoris]|uniref:Uncharacterized protein n=1 Tax=Kangiella sediminilitoris TaxID=1144748 RepID=A0A1B3B7X7_9GAMM|nr:hypothetical protein [Kangiella sediminilitoris]AOE48895.1 hypothetical protein KS2013_166 [Kangiella sediminilitoris]